VANKLDRVFRFAAKRYATSFALWLSSAPFLIGGLVFTELSGSWVASKVAAVLFAGLVSHLALGFVLWVGSKTVLHPSRRDSAGWKEVVSVFALAGLARGLTIGWIIDALGVGPADLFTRVTTAIILIVFSLTFLAYSAQLWNDYRVKRFQLLTSIGVGERTDTLRGIAASELRPLAMGDLEQDVLKAREQTRFALQSIREKVFSDEIDPIDVQKVFDASDTNWRDLSHKAWVASVPNVPKIDLAEIAKTLASSKPISLIVLSAGPAYGFTRVFESLGFASAFLAGAVWCAGVIGISLATNSLAAKFDSLGLQILVAGFAAIQAWAFLVGLWFLQGSSAQEIMFVSFVSSLSAIALGLPPAIERGGQLVLAQLERRLDNAAIENLKSQGEMFVLAQRIGSYLHSEVRGDFLRHSLALREALEQGDSLEAESILDQLDYLVGAINLEESQHSPIDNLTAFLDNWSGVIGITHNLKDVNIGQEFQRSAEAVVMEAVNNAVRHGRASWVAISFTESDDALELQVDSDSEFIAESPTQGLGTQTLNRLAPGRWSRQKIETQGQSPILRFTVSLSPQAP
jgi:hypothetical protein